MSIHYTDSPLIYMGKPSNASFHLRRCCRENGHFLPGYLSDYTRSLRITVVRNAVISLLLGDPPNIKGFV